MIAERKQSAGLLLYRTAAKDLEVFLVHPGGPYFTRKDSGAWSIPKGEIEPDEPALEVARREFLEETGQTIEACGGSGTFIALGSVQQRGGKTVHAWACQGDWPAGAQLHSNTFELEWPPRSGRQQQFPEVDRGGFFCIDEARVKINSAQLDFLDRLGHALGSL